MNYRSFLEFNQIGLSNLRRMNEQECAKCADDMQKFICLSFSNATSFMRWKLYSNVIHRAFRVIILSGVIWKQIFDHKTQWNAFE